MKLDAVLAIAKKKPEYAAGAVGASLGLITLARKRGKKAGGTPAAGILTPAPTSSIDTSSNDLAGWFSDQQNQLLDRIRSTEGGVTPSTSTASGPDAARPTNTTGDPSFTGGSGIVASVVNALTPASTSYVGAVNITSAPTTRVSVTAPLSTTGGTALLSTVNNAQTPQGIAANAAASTAYGPGGYFGTGLAGYSQAVIDAGGLAPAITPTGTTNAFLKKIADALTPAQKASKDVTGTWNQINAEGGYTATISPTTPTPTPAAPEVQGMLANITNTDALYAVPAPVVYPSYSPANSGASWSGAASSTNAAEAPSPVTPTYTYPSIGTDYTGDPFGGAPSSTAVADHSYNPPATPVYTAPQSSANTAWTSAPRASGQTSGR